MNTRDELGDFETLIQILRGTITNFIDDDVLKIKDYAFFNCTNLTNVDAPSATEVGGCAFESCSRLNTINFPSVTVADGCTFKNCKSLVTISLPAVKTIENNLFEGCIRLKKAVFQNANWIRYNPFYGCSKLQAVVLSNPDEICEAYSTGSFSASSSTLFYVPDALIDDYKSATNWSTIADKIKPLSELPAEEGE